MNKILRWVVRVIGSALTIILAIVMFPYVARFASSIMPDESEAASRASAIISTKLENSTWLETLRATEEGVLNYDVKAAFVGSVARIHISYTYEASFGIDLSMVEMKVEDNTITFFLPEPKLLSDHLTPKEVYKEDFWYPGFSEADYIDLLEEEQMVRRNAFLTGENDSLLWGNTVEAFERTISAWMEGFEGEVNLIYLPAVKEE